MNKHPLLAPLVQDFFLDFLTAQRGLSPHTIAAYRDTLKLFLNFIAQKLKKSVDRLTVEDFDDLLIGTFLDHLESNRKNSPRTRNNRLAALHTLFRYVAAQEPTVMGRCQKICSIPAKRTAQPTIEYLEDHEMGALLNGVKPTSRLGLRDYALLLFLYNTGARVQETVDLKVDDVRFDAPSQVKLIGKGRKERACPLWPETVAALKKHLEHRNPPTSQLPYVFLNANGRPITRFGIRHIVRKYRTKVVDTCPSLKSKNVSPHTLRHTTAMHLLQADNDLFIIKDWLGHAHVNTTHGYVEIDMKMKRKALEACEPPPTRTSLQRRSKWSNPGILKWLEDLSKTH